MDWILVEVETASSLRRKCLPILRRHYSRCHHRCPPVHVEILIPAMILFVWARPGAFLTRSLFVRELADASDPIDVRLLILNQGRTLDEKWGEKGASATLRLWRSCSDCG